MEYITDSFVIHYGTFEVGHCMPKIKYYSLTFVRLVVKLHILLVFFVFFQLSISICAMLMGIALFGYIIASTTASMANADAQRARYQEKMKAIKVFLKVGVEGGFFVLKLSSPETCNVIVADVFKYSLTK